MWAPGIRLIAIIPTDPPERCKVDPRELFSRIGVLLRGRRQARRAGGSGLPKMPTMLSGSRGHFLEPSQDARPAPAHAAIAGFVLRPEPGLLHSDPRSVLALRQRPRHDGLQATGRLIAGSVPAVHKALTGNDFENLAIGNAIPTVDGRSAEIEPVADDRLKIVLHQPFLDQRRLRQRAPNLFRRVRHHPFDDEATHSGNRFGHRSILFSRLSSAANRSRP